MSKFSIGSRVVKPESGNHGTVVEVMPPRRGRQLYKVSWEGYISDELEVNLIPDCDIADPYERCINGIFGSYSDFSKKNTTFKIKSKNTVAKYVAELEEKCLISTEPTEVVLKNGKKRNGNLKYKIRPIRDALEYNFEKQLRKNAEKAAIEKAQKKLEKYDKKHPKEPP